MSTDATTRTLLATTAALLDQGRLVDALSRILTAAALVGMMLWPAFATRAGLPFLIALLVAIFGAGQLYLAMRVRFDAALFRRLARQEGTGAFDDLDSALRILDLVPKTKAYQDPIQRAMGAKDLLFRQGMTLMGQIGLILFGAIWVLLGGLR